MWFKRSQIKSEKEKRKALKPDSIMHVSNASARAPILRPLQNDAVCRRTQQIKFKILIITLPTGRVRRWRNDDTKVFIWEKFRLHAVEPLRKNPSKKARYPNVGSEIILQSQWLARNTKPDSQTNSRESHQV